MMRDKGIIPTQTPHNSKHVKATFITQEWWVSIAVCGGNTDLKVTQFANHIFFEEWRLLGCYAVWLM
jgi:hypothetical protein